MKPRIDLLVLDAHGVVLNAYWTSFLREIARRMREPADQIVSRWHGAVRADAWTGRIDDDELWRRLIPTCDGSHDWRAVLEEGYRCGPAAACLRRWGKCGPIWLLSNHRTHWLLPRLARFDLIDRFERVLVSDAIGAAKPEPAAFDAVLKHGTPPQHVLLVDDEARNVVAARRLGLRALHANPACDWIAVVDNLLSLPPAENAG